MFNILRTKLLSTMAILFHIPLYWFAFLRKNLLAAVWQRDIDRRWGRQREQFQGGSDSDWSCHQQRWGWGKVDELWISLESLAYNWKLQVESQPLEKNLYKGGCGLTLGWNAMEKFESWDGEGSLDIFCSVISMFCRIVKFPLSCWLAWESLWGIKLSFYKDDTFMCSWEEKWNPKVICQ